MKITRENYELWFLEYLDGTLDPKMEAEFNAFLSDNPDLAAEINGIEPMVFVPENVGFHDKTKLKKEIFDDKEVFDNSAIAQFEGELSAQAENDFEKFLATHPEKRKDVGLFQKTKLIPDQNILFPNKNSLKKRAVVLPFWTRVASVAAILIFAIILFSKEWRKPLQIENQIVKIEEAQPQKAIPTETKVDTTIKVDNGPNTIIEKKQPKKYEKQTPKKVDKQTDAPLQIKISRDPVVILAEIPRKNIVFELVDDLNTVQDYKSKISQKEHEVGLSEILEPQLAAFRESKDLEILSADHLALSGLQLVAKVSGERLTAKRGADGEVKSVNFNSRLLAFSIPVNR